MTKAMYRGSIGIVEGIIFDIRTDPGSESVEVRITRESVGSLFETTLYMNPEEARQVAELLKGAAKASQQKVKTA
jgi:hypothetical protein